MSEVQQNDKVFYANGVLLVVYITLKPIYLWSSGSVQLCDMVLLLGRFRNDPQKILFYVHKTLENGWSRTMLLNFLELGKGFSYIGREVRIMVGKKEKFMDMLFFNYITRCFVVLEIKAGDFESPNTGQLGTYVVAVNHQMKEEWMNPTIGLLICKDKDEIEAQYALESSSQPLGISSYELSNLIPDNYKGSMPTIEEIEAELAD